jgi:hypothetical protein
MFPSLISVAVAVAIQLPAADVTYEWTSLDGTVQTEWNARKVTVTVQGSRARAREVAAEVRSEFGALAEPELTVKRRMVIVTFRR